MVESLDPNTHPRHALNKREHTRLVLTYLANDRVDLPVTEFGTKFHNFRAFFDAPTENFLVLTSFFRFRVATEFIGQINVLDGKQTQIHIVVEGLGTNHFLTAEFSAFKSLAIAGVKRPFVLTLEMLYDILKESYRCQAAVLLAAVSAVFQVHLLALV